MGNEESEDELSGKCGGALLPLYTRGPGKKFPSEPPSYGAEAGAAQESQGWSEATASRGSGFSSTFSAKSRTQRNTAGVETLNILARLFNESPNVYSRTAVAFSLAGRPLGVVRVNWNPHFLQRCLRLPRCKPFLTVSADPHFGHSGILPPSSWRKHIT
jgi:hypothetical protein